MATLPTCGLPRRQGLCNHFCFLPHFGGPKPFSIPTQAGNILSPIFLCPPCIKYKWFLRSCTFSPRMTFYRTTVECMPPNLLCIGRLAITLLQYCAADR